MSTPAFTRRRALAGVTTAGLALPVLAACGDESSDSTASDTAPEADSSTPSAPSEPGGAAGVVAVADVPVGGGVIIADSEVVVTQPTDGDVKVFSSICTHAGCPVDKVTDTISCPCHASTFDLTTGDVLGGPAPSALPAVDFSVEGGQVVLS